MAERRGYREIERNELSSSLELNIRQGLLQEKIRFRRIQDSRRCFQSCSLVEWNLVCWGEDKVGFGGRASAPSDGPSTSKRLKTAPESAQYLEYMEAMTSKRGQNAGRSWEDLPVVEVPAAPVVEEKEEEMMVVQEDPVDDGTLDDAAWMRQMMSGSLVDEEKVEEVGAKPVEVVSSGGRGPQGEQDPKDLILETGRLFLRNLAFSCSDTDLTTLMAPFGPVSSVHLPLSQQTHQPLGTAFVLFTNPKDALTAFTALDGRSFQGRLLHVLPGRAQLGVAGDGVAGVEGAEGTVKKATLKDGRGEKKKAEASKEFNWAMLYMNSDAVVSSVADRMNISKADILSADSDNAAVKLALAETHVIQETKKYFEDEGILLESLNGSSARSPTTILIKNIPYGTTLATLQEMFSFHGTISRLLLPPAGTLAVVEFTDAHSARSAFKALAYKRLGNAVLYLEKGPAGMFKAAPPPPPPAPTPVASTSSSSIITPNGDSSSTTTTSDTLASAAQGATLFVKNLNFTTTTDLLTSTFSHLPSFLFARVQTKPDPKRPGTTARLSMGFGFVGFKTPETAEAAKGVMDGFRLDGHLLEVKFAQRGAEGGEEKDAKGGVGKGTTTKMIVKNIPFEATKKDIRELFNAYGQVKSVRLPRKFDTKARGFAFLDFISRRDAEAAMLALRHTHLLGRHLILEWAEEETDIEKLREDAKDVVRAKEEGGMKAGKKSKITLL
ncbi:hypothetical protein BDY24DRAFT_370960 [Mrakia frigida]|uniref:RNA-binding ribosome biosynthesis protein MRD1 n=1 Tax=Mrakia frigida TaxID=29902 RepID=UPI003FCC028E